MDSVFIGQKVTHGDSGLVGTVTALPDSLEGDTVGVQTHGVDEQVPMKDLSEPDLG